MRIVDFHCDTLMRLYDLKQMGNTEECVWKNKGQIDLERLVQSGYGAQFFACFLWLEGKPVLPSLYEDALAMADMLHDALSEQKEKAAFAGSYREYGANKRAGKVSAFLTIEEGEILENKVERLNTLYEKGIRMITLTWNYENCLGYPNKEYTYQHKGLKKFGLEALAKMDELGIIADVSHLSDGGFEDVCRYGKRPFIASHSNARSVANHSRNLTDEMIHKLADKGGVTGLNFCGDFLQENKKSTVESMLKQIRYLMNVGGKELVCLGSDFDGVEDALEVNGCHQMNKLVCGMEQAGFSTGEIEAVCYENAEKFMKRYWGE